MLGTDAEDDGPGHGDQQYRFRGGGIASRPVVDIANESVIVQSSNQTITIEDIGTVFMRLNVRSWQEAFESAGTDTTGGEIQ